VPKAGSSLPPKPAPENPDRLIHPTHIRWLYAHGIPEKLALTFGVYSASKEELIFPHPYGLPTEAYLARHFDRPTSKWHKSGSLDYAIPKKHNTLICEDVLSALKWAAADPDNNGFLALQGHAVTRATTSSVFGTSEYTIVWLDNDKGSVIDSAATIASLVAPVSRTVLVLGGTDPKRYPKAELLKVKDECIKLWQSTPADGKPYHVFNVLSPGQGVCT
jgi:hypothetical protein